MAGPLAGLKIIEMAGLGPCPLAGQLMADLGAEVVLIERAAGPDRPLDINNRNKASIALNLKAPEAVDIVLDLVERADVLIEGFRPGVMERLGLGPEVALGRNPALIYGRMTGWGQSGPLSNLAGHDLNYLAMTGALLMTGYADRPPSPPLNLVADYGGGTMFLIFGVLSALFERARSGRGQVIDAAMVDGVGALTGVFRALAAMGQWTAARESNLVDGGAPYFKVYETKDGKYVSVAAIEPQFFAELVEKAGIDPDIAARRDDRATWPEQREHYARVFAGRTRAEWEAVFDLSDACVAPVLSPGEVPGHPHSLARGTYADIGGLLQPMPAPHFSRTPAEPPRPPVPAGSDTRAVLERMGLSAAVIERLEQDGVVSVSR